MNTVSKRFATRSLMHIALSVIVILAVLATPSEGSEARRLIVRYRIQALKAKRRSARWAGGYSEGAKISALKRQAAEKAAPCPSVAPEALIFLKPEMISKFG